MTCINGLKLNINYSFGKGKKFILQFLCFLFIFSPLVASPTYDYQFIDGNGNRYVITKEKLITLQYFPISIEESSSGVYSGGEKKSVFIKRKQYDQFLSLIQKLKWNLDVNNISRRKGESHLFWRKKNTIKYVSFLMNDTDSIEIENLLKGYLTPMTSNSKTSSHAGKKYAMSREESPWLGLTGSYEEEEKSKKIRSLPMNKTGWIDSELPKEVLYEGESLLIKKESEKEVYINSKYFSDLDRIDVTRLGVGESKIIGSILEPKLRDGNLIIPFLLKGQILITYWHTNAEVVCISESKEGNQLIFHFSGTHFYYTNQKNSSSYKFQLLIDLDSGKMSVMGET